MKTLLKLSQETLIKAEKLTPLQMQNVKGKQGGGGGASCTAECGNGRSVSIDCGFGGDCDAQAYVGVECNYREDPKRKKSVSCAQAS